MNLRRFFGQCGGDCLRVWPKSQLTGVMRNLTQAAKVGVREAPKRGTGWWPLAAGYDLWNCTDIVDAEGAGVTSVSVIVFPFALSTKVFSRVTLPWSLYVTFSVRGPSPFTDM